MSRECTLCFVSEAVARGYSLFCCEAALMVVQLVKRGHCAEKCRELPKLVVLGVTSSCFLGNLI